MSDTGKNQSSSPPSRFSPFIVSAVLAFAVILSLWMYGPPIPLGADAPETEFSAQRAMTHIEHIAREIHPIGSQANARVRDYLLETLRGMGVEPQLARTLVPLQAERPPYRFASVDNVMVRLPGATPTKAVLVVGHYDSTPYGVGAADDGSAVASMIETIRALRSGPALRNDVIFLFTDGEEGGLIGPRAFLRHAWYPDVALCLNFEARGYHGPSSMFETCPDNAWLMREFIKAAPHPIANSMMFDVAGRMPTTTDYKVLKQRGLPGLNFAYIGGLYYYHTPNDNPENISRASVQHHGSYALSLTRHFGNLDLSNVAHFNTEKPGSDNLVYFNTLGAHLAYYPVGWVLPLMAVALLLLAATLKLGYRAGRLRLPGLLAGAITLPLTMLAAAALTGALTYIAWRMHHEYMLYNGYWYLGGFLGLTIGLTLLVHRYALRQLRSEELLAGAMLWWAALLIFLSLFFSGASYLALWPLLFVTLGLALTFLGGSRMPESLRRGILLAAGLPAVALMAPAIFHGSEAMTCVLSPVWMAFTVLVLGLLAPALAVLAQPRQKGFTVLAFVAGTLLFVTALCWFQFSPARPRLNHLCYGVNWDTSEAFWMSSDATLDEWTRNFFPDEKAWGTVEEFRLHEHSSFRKAPAPMPAFPPPAVAVKSDTTVDGRRNLVLHVRTQRDAERVILSLPAQTAVFSASINGEALGEASPEDTPWSLEYKGLPNDGLDVALSVAAGAPLELMVQEQSSVLPPVAGVDMPPRPPYMIAEPNTVQWWRDFRSNVVYSVKRFSL